MTRPLPPATTLTRAQYSGWACCWCGNSLQNGGVPAGRARGRIGGHDMGVQVYACLSCTVASPEPPPQDRDPGQVEPGAGRTTVRRPPLRE